MRCLTGVAWSRVRKEIVFMIVGERIWRTRDCFGSKVSVRKGSSSSVEGERMDKREERIST